ncbi:MAG: TetR/AcrR family transcriptional regulator [Actinomycetota bacterium]
MKKVPEDLAAKLYAQGDRFLADGAAVRLDEVAGVVGVPRATLYYYFSGKDDLVSFLMTEKLSRIAAVVEQARAGDGSALDRFCAALRATVCELAANPPLCLNLMIAVGRMDAMAELLLVADRAVMAPLRELLIEARAVGDAQVADIETTVAALMGGVNFAVVQRYSVTGSVDPEALSSELVAQYLDGLRVR